MSDLIIVGSGPAGAWAAWQAVQRGLKPLMVDVGFAPGPGAPLAEDLYRLRKKDPAQADYLLGPRFESLHNLHQAFKSPKVKAPRYAFVTEGSDALGPLQSEGFEATQSFAQGGLANAWGASVYRYDDQDLRAFPFKRADLDPYYDVLTAQIGISGAQDDLAEHFGWRGGLQPPLALDRIAARLLGHYEGRRASFQRGGIKIGRPALALLSQALGEREACRYDNLSFWQPGLAYIYTPAMTLAALRRDGRVDYRPGLLAKRFAANGQGVSLTVERLQDGRREDLQGKKLILAAGTLNSARLVLASFDDTHSRLPLMDNPSTLTPFFHPAHVGTGVQRHSHGLAQLSTVYEGSAWAGAVKGTFYGYSSPLASDVFSDLPLSARGVMAASKYFLPAVTALQLFYAAKPVEGNDLSLTPEGRLRTRCSVKPALGAVEAEYISALRRGGFLSHASLVKALPAGNGIHYAGTLPMSDDSKVPYRTDAQGRLLAASNVHVADASVFPELPAKNHSFTAMAIAMRVADAVADALGSSA